MYYDDEYQSVLESVELVEGSLSQILTEGLKPILAPNQYNFIYISNCEDIPRLWQMDIPSDEYSLPSPQRVENQITISQ